MSPMPQGNAWQEIKKKIAPSDKKIIKEHRDIFWRYVSERFQIHQRRYVEEKEFPWTDDPILRDYHFTNVFRVFDSGTIRLLELIAKRKPKYRQDAIWMVVQYRWPNYHTLMEKYGIIPHNFSKSIWLGNIERTKQEFGKWHTSAHIVLQSNFKQSRAENFLQYLGLLDESFEEFCSGILNAPDMETAFKNVKKFKGFGGFTAYEILIDLCYIGVLPRHFLEQFANPGPGCKEGIDLIYPNRDLISYQEAMERLRDNQDRAFARLGLQPTPRLTLQDIEFSLCEISKYIKIKNGTGRRRLYRHGT